MKNCGNCYYFKSELPSKGFEYTSGSCRKNPPSLSILGDGWPEVGNRDWCGSWAPKSESKE